MAVGKLQKNIMICALALAIIMASIPNSFFSFIGILYYSFCIFTVIRNKNRSLIAFLLWLAVCVHLALICYSLWIWHTLGIFPCFYCISAAGLVLLATIAFHKLRLSIIPITLMLAMWIYWP